MAYLTVWINDRDDPGRYFTGFSWRAPRTEKFYARLPGWTKGRNIQGLFLDGDKAILRATRMLRDNIRNLDVQLTGHVPVDAKIIEELEEDLRILPFLPQVRLHPAWLEVQTDTDEAGWRLPLGTKLVLPARDWRTGTPRWIVYHARAYLPVGSERWTVLSALIILALLPFFLSIWGAYFTFRRSVHPLSRLLTGIRRVETGDLEYRLADTGHSEVALAAQAFDRMADSLKEQVQELAEKQKVEEVSELKSRFISMVSHDLKTPLASITGAAENVLEELAGPVTERQRTYLAMILSSSENLQQMITDLLDLSRIESGRLTLELESIDLEREVENVLQSIRPLLEDRGIDARIIDTADGAAVRADRTRLWQIFNNIVSNAVRHSPDGGRLEIHIDEAPAFGASDGDYMRVIITDEGPGIPEEELPRIFEPFYSRPAGPKGKRGTGLGLAIVRQLVELHGGEIRIENIDAGGARVTFTLPKA
jgi:signal transduction histidine kinase